MNIWERKIRITKQLEIIPKQLKYNSFVSVNFSKIFCKYIRMENLSDKIA